MKERVPDSLFFYLNWTKICVFTGRGGKLSHARANDLPRIKEFPMARKPKINCPVPDCETMIDFRATMCKTHSNMKRHNPEFETLEELAAYTVYLNTLICAIPNCGRDVKKAGRICLRCAQIKSNNPEFTDEQIGSHKTHLDIAQTRQKELEVFSNNNLKRCPSCSEVKSMNEYTNSNMHTDGVRSYCKACERINAKERYHLVESQDPHYRLRKAVSQSIRKALRASGRSKQGISCMEYLDYSIDELKDHLTSLFTPEMNWDNYGTYWVIDHIKPQAMFPYQSMESDVFKECWALENLRPLHWYENNTRGSLYDGKRYYREAVCH